MQVREAATMQIDTVTPTETVYEVSRKMSLDRVGFLPVVDKGKLVGVITDRDLVVRCMAENRNPLLTSAAEVMTTPAWWVYDDAELEGASEEMMRKSVRRLVVKNHLEGSVGVISLDDVARKATGEDAATRILKEVARKPPVGVGARKSDFDFEE